MGDTPLTYGSSETDLLRRYGEFFMPSVLGISLLRVAFLLAGDGVCVLGAVFLAAFQTMPADWVQGFSSFFRSHLLFAAFFMATWVVAAARQGLLLPRRRQMLPLELYGVAMAVIVSLVFSGFAITLLSSYRISTSFLTYFGISALVLLGLFRAATCIALWTAHQWGYSPRHVLLVGANPRTALLLATIARQGRLGYHIVGILDDDSARLEHVKGFKVPYLGKFEHLEKVLLDHVVDEVHVCLPVRSGYELIQSVAHLCVGVGVSVRLIADLFPLELATSRVYRIGNIPMLSLSTVPETMLPLAIKRLIDILVSLTLLTGLSPFFALVALAIKWDSPGPVLFAQERVGVNKRRFMMFKFRSMVVDAERKRGDLDALNEVLADVDIPEIRMGDGRILKGYECWWIPVEECVPKH